MGSVALLQCDRRTVETMMRLKPVADSADVTPHFIFLDQFLGSSGSPGLKVTRNASSRISLPSAAYLSALPCSRSRLSWIPTAVSWALFSFSSSVCWGACSMPAMAFEGMTTATARRGWKGSTRVKIQSMEERAQAWYTKQAWRGFCLKLGSSGWRIFLS